ncbi:glycosyltransferase family 2 protein [Anaerocolumna sp. MB42-C2]|uniref:glycosyltransferase family 2 protein n=1 Tax=Anaerocolumna sp. MB42-C2 TaxID=3070997 RepID=UPI0027E0C98D|nr:glycosyltransferase family 2 protein [Anaerocolumna sp. MB42-C2]WMJ87630.1 glycosyltransferase family 2 protein [Anaerocolumna sp. MB42-C2]
MNRVNIIMATYNGEKYIREQIESILKNTYRNWKLWIFDDGSTDNTKCIIEEYVRRLPDNIMFQQNNKTKGVTLNFLEGVQYAADYNRRLQEKATEHTKVNDEDSELAPMMDYYMFCDQDDVWMTDKIDKTMIQMKKIEKKYGQDIPLAVFTDALVVDSNLNILNRSFYKCSKLDTRKVDLPHIMMENKLIGCTVMFNETLRNYMNVQPVNARYHDWWVALIAAAFGKIYFLPTSTLFYRQHGGNVVGNQNFLSYLHDRISSLKKQKEVIYKTALQADEFYRIFEPKMPTKQKLQVYSMANILKQNWIKRRHVVLKFGFMKTGILRNLGLLYIL